MTDLIEKALKAIFPESDRIVIYSAYGGHESRDALLAGFEEVKERRARGDLMKPVLIYGFDPEKVIRKHQSGSILDALGVFYLRLPAFLSEIKEEIEKMTTVKILSAGAIDERSFRDYAAKKIRSFKHRLDNVCAAMEMNANRARMELERSPGVMPKALLEIKSSNIWNILSEYKEHEDLVMRLGISKAEKVREMMKALLAESRRIERKTTAPSEALDLAFKGVKLGRGISSILGQAKEL